MIKPLRNNAYHNEAGRWDLEVDFEDDPTGEDVGCDILYYKVLGPKRETFTYKLRFTGQPVVLPGPDPGNLDQEDLKRKAALFLVRDLIKAGRHIDVVASHLGKKWAFSKPAEPLIRHSEADPVAEPVAEPVLALWPQATLLRRHRSHLPPRRRECRIEFILFHLI